MSLTLTKASGSQTAVVGTEHTLATETAAGIFTLTVNLRNMVNGDVVELRAYAKVLTGDTNPSLVYEQPYGHQQGDGAAPGSSAKGFIVAKSPPVESPFSLVWTLKQTAGTARVFDWREDQLA